MIHPILGLMRHLSPFTWSIYSFGDPREVIGGRSSPRNGLWHPWYILYKIWYFIYKLCNILHKIWYIQSLSYQDPYLITHGWFVHLKTIEKWLEVVLYPKMDFRTQCTFLWGKDEHPWFYFFFFNTHTHTHQ